MRARTEIERHSDGSANVRLVDYAGVIAEWDSGQSTMPRVLVWGLLDEIERLARADLNG